MPKRYSKRRVPKKSKPSKLKTVQKMTGNEPNTLMEKIANYGGKIGAVAGTVAKIMALINVETKYKDYTQTPATVANASGYSAILNALSQGSAEDERAGEKVVSKDLIFQYSAKINASATNTLLTFFIAYDKKPEVGSVAYTDVMASANPISLINKDNSDRFVLLKKITLNLNSNGRQSAIGKIYIPLTRIHCSWNSSTSTDFEQGRIFMMAISDEATNQPTLGFTSRYNYYDN